jgi:hypothetical protein
VAMAMALAMAMVVVAVLMNKPRLSAMPRRLQVVSVNNMPIRLWFGHHRERALQQPRISRYQVEDATSLAIWTLALIRTDMLLRRTQLGSDNVDCMMALPR